MIGKVDSELYFIHAIHSKIDPLDNQTVNKLIFVICFEYFLIDFYVLNTQRFNQ